MSVYPQNKNTLFSIEVFPPKDDVALASILNNMPRFAALKPDYISVTYGAGGSQIGTALEIASLIKNTYNITPVAHLTCAGNTRDEIDAALKKFKAVGITHILALRGDLKEGRSVSDFLYATDLINYINNVGGFEISAACYPEGHPENTINDFDFDVIKMKYDLGVRHFISQLFFDNDDFYKMVEKAKKLCPDAKFDAGVMPITNIKQITRTIGFSGSKLPAKLTKFVSRFENNPVALRQAGINYALDQISDLIVSGADGVHVYVMNSTLTATAIYDGIKSILDEVNS